MKIFLKLVKNLLFLIILAVVLMYIFLNHKMILSECSGFFNRSIAYYYVWLGDESLKKKDFQMAVDHYKKAIYLYPAHVKARYNLGNIYFAYEDFISASKEYKGVISVNPNYLNARINLGLIYSMQYKLNKAILEYTKAVNIKPQIIKIPYIYNNEENVKYNMSIAQYNLGVLYMLKADTYDHDPYIARKYLLKSIKWFKQSIKLNPHNFSPHYNLAVCYQRLKIFTKASQYYCSAIKINPFRFEPHYNLGLILSIKKRYKDAVLELQKAAMVLGAENKGTQVEHVTQVMFDLISRTNYNLDDRSTSPKENNKDYEELTKKLEGAILDPYIQIDKAKLTEKEEQKVTMEDMKSIEWNYKNGKVTIPDDILEEHPKMIKEMKKCYLDE